MSETFSVVYFFRCKKVFRGTISTLLRRRAVGFLIYHLNQVQLSRILFRHMATFDLVMRYQRVRGAHNFLAITCILIAGNGSARGGGRVLCHYTRDPLDPPPRPNPQVPRAQNPRNPKPENRKPKTET